MKKHTLLLGILISLFFACSSDDEDSTPNNNPVGTYTLTSAKTAVPIDSNANGTFDDTELMNNVDCIPKIILKADNTFVIDDFSIYQSASWGNGNVSIDPVICEQYSTFNGSYSITDGSLIFTTGQESIIYTISENKITRTGQESYFTSSTASNPSTISVTYTYTK